MDVNISQVTAFIAVYDTGSFALASHKIGKHASTLSRQISNLETELGYELFERHASALTPNHHADELYEYAKAVKFELDQFNRRALNVLQMHPTKLTLALDSSTLGMNIPTALVEVTEKFPTLDLRFIDGTTQECIDSVERGEADLAVVLSAEQYNLDIAVAKLQAFTASAVTSASYAKKFGIKPFDTISQLKQRKMRQVILKSFQDIWHHEVLKCSHHCHSVSNFSCALDLIVNGVGWGIVPHALTQNLIDSGELVSFKVERESILRWSVDAIWLASKPLSEPLQLLIDTLSRNATHQ
ncbi:LysR family transcriptional regulator [Vibrio sp. SCSIO 43136]|uniref:LysR family transcriptional regulator n=1 Tax=Vibrio sp. SCSIO 43136 TaxID=2819101 RepID=UPI002075CC75|nr:LysR family transcriptional regulator [Vibrio sp. SCSIO 43136]USD67140.1 LysR family transcriptional regulator [Vibrio sp. SCSIO 43136]